MGEFNAKDANFLWRQIGRIDGVIETLNRTEGEMPEIIAGVLKRIRDDIDKFVDNKTKDYENIYKNDIIKASAISTGADRGVLLCSITDSGFTSIAGVISAVKDKLPGKDHKKMIFEIRNDGRNEYGRYNNCGGKI